jgi:hypothetical protein
MQRSAVLLLLLLVVEMMYLARSGTGSQRAPTPAAIAE